MAGPANRTMPARTTENLGSGTGHVTGQPARRLRTLKPRDAATLVLVDHAHGEPRILMGRRRADQVFLPNKFVFPGGRVDPADRTIDALDDLPATDHARLLYDMKGRPSAARARALALAAIRETYEEAGLVIGAAALARTDRKRWSGGKDDAAATSWQRFLATGFAPRLSTLTFFARAITPPARPRRYDTRFFMADASTIACRKAAVDEELGEVGWFTLDEIRNLDLPNITRAVVEDLASLLATPQHGAPVPYYRFQRGTFRRDLIT